MPLSQSQTPLRLVPGSTDTPAGQDFRGISQWETGRKMPSLKMLLRYLDALGLDLHDLQATFDAFDQMVKRPGGLRSRITDVERRLSVLERWRLAELATSGKLVETKS